jgi:hypothetical protein
MIDKTKVNLNIFIPFIEDNVISNINGTPVVTISRVAKDRRTLIHCNQRSFG